jgi:hypothetical protein
MPGSAPAPRARLDSTPPLTPASHGSEQGAGDHTRLRELECEVRELRRRNEVLAKAAAFFAEEYRRARPATGSSLGR